MLLADSHWFYSATYKLQLIAKYNAIRCFEPYRIARDCRNLIKNLMQSYQGIWERACPILCLPHCLPSLLAPFNCVPYLRHLSPSYPAISRPFPGLPRRDRWTRWLYHILNRNWKSGHFCAYEIKCLQICPNYADLGWIYVHHHRKLTPVKWLSLTWEDNWRYRAVSLQKARLSCYNCCHLATHIVICERLPTVLA